MTKQSSQPRRKPPRFNVAALFFMIASTAAAQTDLATIRGVVTEQTNAVIPRARVVLTNMGTNNAREVRTNEQGAFEIPFVVQGTYRLSVTADGFKTFIAEDLVIRAREVRRIDARLELGAVGAEVTVKEGAAVIATEGSQIAGGFNREAFVNSSLSQSFFPQAYMTTLPNIQTQQGGWSLKFAGQPSNQVAQNMDGVTNDGTVNLVQNMQDFDDLQVVAVNNSAEFARVAQFSMASKGGTNEYHGRVYYDLVNSALNARSFFETRKTPYKEHRGGANVSGPIIRNKLFFYAGYSLQRIPSQSFYLRDVPMEAMRNGDFSAFLKQAKPVQLKDPLTGADFPGNIIPQDRINPVSQKTQDLYIPQPNRGAGNSTFQNFGFLHSWPIDLYKWDSITTRVDYVINPRNQLFGRFINRLTPYVLPGPFPHLGTWTRDRNHHSIVVNDTHTFSPTLVNSFQWGWAKDYFIDGSTVDGFTPQKGQEAIDSIGLQGVNQKGFDVMGFPTMSILGVQTLSQNVGGVNLNRNDQEFSDNVTWAKGRHVLKFGGELRYFHDAPQGIPSTNFGSFNFNGSLSGIGYADFLLGLPYSSTRIDPLTNRTQTAYELGLFVQDTFKVNQRLTLDLGLRWDYFRNALYKDGLQYNWDPETGNVIVPEAALNKVSPFYPKSIKIVAGNPFPSPKRDNIRPRLGVAYRVSDKFVVRAGYGAYTEALGNLHRASGGGPFQVAETYFNQIVDQRALLSFPNPFPGSIGLAALPSQSVIGYSPDTSNGTIHQFNVSLEREFRWGLGGRLSYIGSRSTGMNYELELNKPEPSRIPFSALRRPYPQFVSTRYWQNDCAVLSSRYSQGTCQSVVLALHTRDDSLESSELTTIQLGSFRQRNRSADRQPVLEIAPFFLWRTTDRADGGLSPP